MCLEAADVRRCRCVAVPRDLSATVHVVGDGAPNGTWLAAFEDELALALADYAACREQGTPTLELADYIEYLNACVACLSKRSGSDVAALAAIERFARVRNTTTA
jgi:hypothetical protein